MTKTMTPWGYEADMEHASIIDAAALATRTGSSDSRAGSMIEAVTDAIRNECGWHVAPVLECEYQCDGRGRIVALPATYVASVESVKVNGEDVEYRLCDAGRGGIIDLRYPADEFDIVTVVYTAGYEKCESLKQAIANAVASALVTPNGIERENAGTVSFTYSNAGDASFVPTDRLLRALARYKLVRGL